ncbi:hypothetical protein K458DRAFT_302717, partial [Lentithecium fluviatile CBS 122367]
MTPEPSTLCVPPPTAPRRTISTKAPRPPAHLFRTLRPLAGDNSKATWLCLPKKVEHGALNESAKEDSVGEVVYRALQTGKVSTLQLQDLRILPQLFIVKTHRTPSKLRHESDILERLHHKEGCDESGSFVGSCVVRQQITRAPESSWWVLRPVFGTTLQRFGEISMASNEPVPSWLVWHLFLCLLKTLEFLHARGVAHNNINSENTMLNLYPPRGKHQFRDYPDIVLVDFDNAGSLTDEAAMGDIRNVLTVVQDVVQKWSDLAMLSQYLDAESENNDPLAILERDLKKMQQGSTSTNLQPVKDKWSAIATANREKGPLKLPARILQKAHDDLAREEELHGASSVVLKFSTK